jgi:hypothetical protein
MTSSALLCVPLLSGESYTEYGYHHQETFLGYYDRLKHHVPRNRHLKITWSRTVFILLGHYAASTTHRYEAKLAKKKVYLNP